MSNQAKAAVATRWSLIVRAQQGGVERRAALGELLAFYDGFVVSLLRRYRYPPDLCLEELKQEFFTVMLKNEAVDTLDRERGSFRGWLNVAVRRFLLNEWSKWHAAKAGRKVTVLSAPELLDAAGSELGAADSECLRAYARSLVLHVLTLQREEARDPQRFDALSRFIPGPQLRLEEYGPYADDLGMTAIALAKAVCVMRGRFKELVRTAIRDLNDLGGDADQAVDQELAELRRYLFS